MFQVLNFKAMPKWGVFIDIDPRLKGLIDGASGGGCLAARHSVVGLA